MPDFMFLDTEFGGLPDREFTHHVIGLTQVSAAAVDYTKDWSEVKIAAFFDCHVKPVPGMIYDSEALSMQAECVSVRNSESKALESHFLEADAGSLFDPEDFGEDPPSVADVFFCWLTLNGREEPSVLRAFKSWSEHYFGPDSYKVSCWAHNVEADLNMITAAVDRCFPSAIVSINGKETNNMLPCNRAGRCSMILFRILRDMGLHNRYKANLDTVIAYYGVEVPEAERHTSRGDVIATVTAIGCMMRQLRAGAPNKTLFDQTEESHEKGGSKS